VFFGEFINMQLSDRIFSINFKKCSNSFARQWSIECSKNRFPANPK